MINDIDEGDKKRKKMGIDSTGGQRIIFIKIKSIKVVSNVEVVIEDKIAISELGIIKKSCSAASK